MVESLRWFIIVFVANNLTAVSERRHCFAWQVVLLYGGLISAIATYKCRLQSYFFFLHVHQNFVKIFEARIFWCGHVCDICEFHSFLRWWSIHKYRAGRAFWKTVSLCRQLSLRGWLRFRKPIRRENSRRRHHQGWQLLFLFIMPVILLFLRAFRV